MIFSLVTFVLILGIAYFHWVQGLLSGIISVALALIAATMAIGYHESIVTGIMGGKVADMANAIMLCVIFTAIYGIGRLVFDSLIPGNVRLPLYVDKVGAGVCGLIVGICAVGVFAIALQSMPLGPSILMHSRYEIAEDREVTVNGPRRQETAMITGALAEDRPDESKDQGLWIGADSMMVNYTAYQSEAGALAGGVKLRDRHPNLLRELFFQRVGIENAAKRTALNIAGKTDVTVTNLFAPPTPLLQMDGENPSLNRGRKLPKTFASDPSKVTLVVRISVKRNATDTDSRFRFSPGSIRILADGKDYWPLGTLYEPGRVNLLMNYRIDDYLVAEMDKETGEASIDLVFSIPKADLLADPAAKEGLKIKDGTFIEVKRFARVDLSEKDVLPSMPNPAPGAGMLYKKEAIGAIAARMAETGDSKP